MESQYLLKPYSLIFTWKEQGKYREFGFGYPVYMYLNEFPNVKFHIKIVLGSYSVNIIRIL